MAMEFSVVIPIYHTASNSIKHIQSVIAALQNKYTTFEIIFIIDNNYVSANVQELFLLEMKYKCIKVHQLNKNYGQQFATLCGYYLANGDYILTVDEDMTHYIPLACKTKAYTIYDVYYFYYNKDLMYESDIRKKLSNIYKSIIMKVVNLKRSSTFRIISQSLRDKLISNKHIYWNIDVSIFNNTNSIGSEEIEHIDFSDNNSAYNYKKLFQMAFEIAYEHNTIFMNLIFAMVPAIIYFWKYHDTMRTTVVYIFFAVLITSIFVGLKILSPSTASKIKKALKQKTI